MSHLAQEKQSSISHGNTRPRISKTTLNNNNEIMNNNNENLYFKVHYRGRVISIACIGIETDILINNIKLKTQI